MPRYQTTFSCPVPITEAFAYLSRFSTTAEWDPGVVAARDLTPDPVGLGSAFEIITSIAGRRVPLRYEIIAFDAPNVVTLQAENASIRSTDTMSFSAGPDGGTTITYDAELIPRGLTRVFGPLLTLMFNRIGDRAAEGLRAAMDRLARDTSRERSA